MGDGMVPLTLGHHRDKAVQYNSLANNNVNSKAICIPVFAASRIGWCLFHIVIGFWPGATRRPQHNMRVVRSPPTRHFAQEIVQAQGAPEQRSARRGRLLPRRAV